MNPNPLSFEISGHIADVVHRTLFDGVMRVENGKIVSIRKTKEVEDQYLLPGLVDAHIHIESSMLLPSEFARVAVRHGTVACVCDPHEIANVCGAEGIRYLIENGKRSSLKFFFGAPSCVPATPFEKAGARLTAADTAALLADPDIWFLGEMMNFPGVLAGDPEVLGKLEAARRTGKPIDGHAPQLAGEALQRYAAAGITTDHECTTLAEAREKMANGFHILIREGSCARNREALLPLLREAPEQVMFCSDDRHAHDLLEGHINTTVRRALRCGYDLFAVLRAASYHPVRHYRLPVGLLQPGDPADFIVVGDLQQFDIRATYLNGMQVAENGKELLEPSGSCAPINRFRLDPVDPASLQLFPQGNRMRVIGLCGDQLLTRTDYIAPKIVDGLVVPDPENDIVKAVVCNRYHAVPLRPAFIRGLGLKRGAIASTIAHDSHHLIAAGCNDSEMAAAINLLVRQGGGIAVCDGPTKLVLPLPVAGLMSTMAADPVAEQFRKILETTRLLGSPLPDPFMTLSFMALPVIPELKLSDEGLFDVNRFAPVPLFPST